MILIKITLPANKNPKKINKSQLRENFGLCRVASCLHDPRQSPFPVDSDESDSVSDDSEFDDPE